jgi:beta-fructofuranosidase
MVLAGMTGFGVDGVPASPSPFDDAVAVWHFADLQDAARRNELKIVGEAKVGVRLGDAERQDSLSRGGDGAVAQIDGGYLDAGQGTGGALNVKGSVFTLYVRLRSPSGAWGGPLFSKHDGHDKLDYNLFSSETAIGFELGTQRTPKMTQVQVPVARIGPADWHDLVCRYDGAKLRMFVDGVWVDEGFPMGPLREGNTAPCLVGAESVDGAVKSGWKGQIDHVALWGRALSDAEIERLAGGAEAVAVRARKYLGELPSMQYYKPPDPFNIGDTLPFFHDGVFHFYYLLDRGHHVAKNGLGAHQWAHASSTDLVHWQGHPLAVPITDEGEGSICTGSMFFHAGTFYAFYATRGTDRGERLSLATGTDGIRFEKTQPNPFLVPGPRYAHGFRDPHVFRDARTGLFHLIVSTALREGGRACLAQYVSKDLKAWEETEPFLVEEKKEVPECPDYFEWNGRYYLIFSYGQVARYRMSKDPLGPWTKPAVEVIDGGAARVIKTAAFTGNRRIATASVWPQGYAGWAVFRELVQNPDGTLGSAFVREMIPRCGESIAMQFKALEGGATGDGRAVRLEAPEGRASAALTPLPPDARVRLRVDGAAEALVLNLRASDADARGVEVRILPVEKRVAVTGGSRLADVDGLDKPFTLDIVLKDRILDLCLNGQRTLVSRVAAAKGDRLVLSAEKGRVAWYAIEVSPLP